MKEEKKKRAPGKVLSAVLEVLGELLVMAVFFAVGLGVMALLGNRDAVENMDPELVILLGILVIFAAVFVVTAIVMLFRKKKKSK